VPDQSLDSHEHQLPEAPFPVDRVGHLAALCCGRRVLHIGCADDTAIEDKLADGRHLHGRLAEVADVVGLDLAADRLVSLGRHGFERLVAGSASAPPFRRGAFDDIVLGEILEHLSDPGDVLRGLRRAGLARRLIVTVPNAYSFYLARQLGRGVEVVNPDHLYTFTPVTLQTLLGRAGWKISSLRTYAWTIPTSPGRSFLGAVKRVMGDQDAGPARPRALLDNAQLWRAYRSQPFRGDGLIAVSE